MDDQEAQKMVKENLESNTEKISNTNVSAPKSSEVLTSLLPQSENTPDLIRQAEEVVAKLKAENDRREQLYSREILSGRSFGGQIEVKESEEVKRKREVNEYLKGTGLKI